MKIQIIIFSFNRAMQLDALLRSIVTYWKAHPQISIIYNTSDELYEEGYKILRNNYQVDFYKEKSRQSHCYHAKDYFSYYNSRKWVKHPKLRFPKTDFREIVQSIVEDSACEYVMFLTDDSVFIRDVQLPDLGFIRKNSQQLSFSLRLGASIKPSPQDLTQKDDLLFWNYYDNTTLKNWGYPFSVDGHIYHKTFISTMLRKCIFNNPSSLETMLCFYAFEHRLLSQGCCHVVPSMLSFPLNMVQTVADNESQDVSVQMLNERFLQGQGIKYPIPNEFETFQQYPDYICFEKDGYTEKLQLNAPTRKS